MRRTQSLIECMTCSQAIGIAMAKIIQTSLSQWSLKTRTTILSSQKLCKGMQGIALIKTVPPAIQITTDTPTLKKGIEISCLHLKIGPAVVISNQTWGMSKKFSKWEVDMKATSWTGWDMGLASSTTKMEECTTESGSRTKWMDRASCFTSPVN